MQEAQKTENCYVALLSSQTHIQKPFRYKIFVFFGGDIFYFEDVFRKCKLDRIQKIKLLLFLSKKKP